MLTKQIEETAYSKLIIVNLNIFLLSEIYLICADIFCRFEKASSAPNWAKLPSEKTHSSDGVYSL